MEDDNLADPLGSATIVEVQNRRYWSLYNPAASSGYYEEQEMDGDGEDFGEVLAKYDVKQEGGRFVAYFSLDGDLMGHVVGKSGSTLKRMEQETGASFRTPPRGTPNEKSAVTVRATSESQLARALARLELLIDNVLSSPKTAYNFFVSIPLTVESTRNALRTLHRTLTDVADTGSVPGLEVGMVTPPEKMHLTVAMLKLYSNDARTRCLGALKRVEATIKAQTRGQGLRFRLKGLDVMNDDPSEAHVVFLKVQEMQTSSVSFQGIVDMVVKELDEAGVMREKDGRPVKLHATVINTRHGKGAQGGGRRTPVDVRGLLSDHGEYDAGEVTVTEMHLSQRGAYDASGYYRCAGRVQF